MVKDIKLFTVFCAFSAWHCADRSMLNAIDAVPVPKKAGSATAEDPCGGGRSASSSALVSMPGDVEPWGCRSLLRVALLRDAMRSCMLGRQPAADADTVPVVGMLRDGTDLETR